MCDILLDEKVKLKVVGIEVFDFIEFGIMIEIFVVVVFVD